MTKISKSVIFRMSFLKHGSVFVNLVILTKLTKSSKMIKKWPKTDKMTEISKSVIFRMSFLKHGSVFVNLVILSKMVKSSKNDQKIDKNP